LNIYEITEDYLRNETGGTLATIVNKVGATPQHAGAKIFIGGDGKIFGTIGGGCLEAEVWQEARRISNTNENKLLHFAMNGSCVEDEGMICGGSVDVFLEPVLQKYHDVYKGIKNCMEEDDRALVITTFFNRSFTKTLLYRDGKTLGDPLPENIGRSIEGYFDAGKLIFQEGAIIEPIAAPSHLYIFGAGHVSQYISTIAKIAEFEVTVIDDRESFANKERFPEADEIIVEEFKSVFKRIHIKPDEYAVIVTRGHAHDAFILEEVLKKPCRYMGMIGSKRKTKIIFDHLKTAEVDENVFNEADAPLILLQKTRKKVLFDENILNKVHAPIGIDIGAETPQEIAVSIVAELIRERRAKKRRL